MSGAIAEDLEVQRKQMLKEADDYLTPEMRRYMEIVERMPKPKEPEIITTISFEGTGDANTA